MSLLHNELPASCVVIPAEAGIQNSLILKNWISDDYLGNDKTVFLQKVIMERFLHDVLVEMTATDFWRSSKVPASQKSVPDERIVHEFTALSFFLMEWLCN